MRARKFNRKPAPQAKATETAPPAPSAANQVMQIWLKGLDQPLLMNLQATYADRLAAVMDGSEPIGMDHAFLVLRHRLVSATVVRRSDLQAVRAVNAIEVFEGIPAPQGNDVWISLKDAAEPVKISMAEVDAWELCDLFYALELGPSEGDHYRLHGKAGDLVTIRAQEIIWVMVADAMLREGRRQVAIQDGLPLDVLDD
jgi:hypothetical protein